MFSRMKIRTRLVASIVAPFCFIGLLWAYADVGMQQMQQRLHELARPGAQVAETVREADLASRKVRQGMLLGAAVAGLMCVVLGGMLVASILRPLCRLNEMLKDVAEGEGDLTRRIKVASKDELGEMGGYFNAAWDKLDRMIARVVEQSTLVGTYSGQLLIESSRIVKNSCQIAERSTAVATAGEEMSATSNDIARNCAMAAESSREAGSVAASGQEVVQKTMDRMGVIRNEVESSSRVIRRLSASSEQIGEIAGTIEEIADQTNLLALNAAIEAARAGEQGRGFAVVADEVRALAERTALATKEIGEMIRTVQTEARQAVEAMERSAKHVTVGVEEASKSGTALASILGRIGEVTMQVSQIATAAEEQTATTVEIVSCMGEISHSADRFDRAAAGVNGKIAQLQALSEELIESTAVFKTDVAKLLMLDTAKHDHVMFVTRIERCLEGKEQVQSNVLPDHTCCRFGKWYFGEGKDACGGSATFKAVNAPHELIHVLAKQAVDLFNQGDPARAEQKLIEVEDLSFEIVNMLDQVKSECSGLTCQS